jgi:hypothetical protein
MILGIFYCGGGRNILLQTVDAVWRIHGIVVWWGIVVE